MSVLGRHVPVGISCPSIQAVHLIKSRSVIHMHLTLTLKSKKCCNYKAWGFLQLSLPSNSLVLFSQGSQVQEDVWAVGTSHHGNGCLEDRQRPAPEAPGSGLHATALPCTVGVMVPTLSLCPPYFCLSCSASKEHSCPCCCLDPCWVAR